MKGCEALNKDVVTLGYPTTDLGTGWKREKELAIERKIAWLN